MWWSPDNGWQVSGLLRIDEVATATGYRAPEGEYETIGGLVLQELGHIPEAGETVELTAFDPDGPLEDPVRWQADGGADGRPPDRPARADRARPIVPGHSDERKGR